MNSQLYVYLFGSDAEGADVRPEHANVTFRAAGERPLGEVEADELNELVEDTETALVGFSANARVFDEQDGAAVFGEFDSADNCAALLLPYASSSSWCRSWSQYPARLAVLIAAPEFRAAVVFRKSALDRIGRFEAVSQPVWDWLIRAAAAGCEISVAPGAEASGWSVDVSDALPVLAPDCPGAEMGWLHQHLVDVRPDELLPQITSESDSIALKAGLLQLHDSLDESHRLSQSVEGAGLNRAGDYWHAIMHRREPDYSNSKYWFRRVGDHPVFNPLAERAGRILAQTDSRDARAWQQRLQTPHNWDPFAFIDLCEACAKSKQTPLARAARQIQWEEMLLLLHQTYEDALG